MLSCLPVLFQLNDFRSAAVPAVSLRQALRASSGGVSPPLPAAPPLTDQLSEPRPIRTSYPQSSVTPAAQRLTPEKLNSRRFCQSRHIGRQDCSWGIRAYD